MLNVNCIEGQKDLNNVFNTEIHIGGGSSEMKVKHLTYIIKFFSMNYNKNKSGKCSSKCYLKRIKKEKISNNLLI